MNEKPEWQSKLRIGVYFDTPDTTYDTTIAPNTLFSRAYDSPYGTTPKMKTINC